MADTFVSLGPIYLKHIILFSLFSLPGNVSAQLSEDILDQCATDKLAEMGEDKKWKKCEKKYSDEEKASRN